VTGVITQIVAALGDTLNVLLTNAQQRPLQDGKILIGREHVADGSAAPRVVMIPMTSRYEVARHSPSTYLPVDANGRALRWRARPLWSEALTLQCHCWGDTESFSATDPARGFNAAQALTHRLFTAAYLIMTANGCRPTAGAWGDQATDQADLLTSGHYTIVGLEVDIPITDQALRFVPPGTMIERPDPARSPLFTAPAGD
jgi:hypothetical protein